MTSIRRPSQDGYGNALRELQEEIKQLRAAIQVYEAIIAKLTVAHPVRPAARTGVRLTPMAFPKAG